ncbi:hypothetical protein BGW38_004094, partial [Lunasporangiospora selenospora]
PWGHFMDLAYMDFHSGTRVVEWQTLKPIDSTIRESIISRGNRTHVPALWNQFAERMPCQVIRGYGHDYLHNVDDDSIGGDFAYQHLLDIEPIPVPGFTLEDTVSYVDDILERNRNSTEQVICLTYTFTAQFERNKNRWDIGWNEMGHYLRFLPRFESFVEDLVAYRFGIPLNSSALSVVRKGHDDNETPVEHPRPPQDLGTSILDQGDRAQTFLDRKPQMKQDYIAIHLRRGDIMIKCTPINQTINSNSSLGVHGAGGGSDCIVPLSVYKAHVDAIVAKFVSPDVLADPSRAGTQGRQQRQNNPSLLQYKPSVVLVSDTQSDQEKAEIDNFGWYRLDHALDPNLLDATKVLGPFSPVFIDSAVLTGRGARWVIGSRRSTMSWLAAMRITSWYDRTIIYPRQQMPPTARARMSRKRSNENKNKGTPELRKSDQPHVNFGHEDGDIVVWEKREIII